MEKWDAEHRKAVEGEPVRYQCREIGEGGWVDCDKARYDSCQRRPEMDTRISSSPLAELEAILAYARQQKQFGSPTCRIPPGDMVEIMERLLAQPVSGGYKLNSPEIPDGWIACSERMPDDEQECLVQTHSGFRYVSFYDEHTGLFYDMPGGNQVAFVEHILVTHWMPLPAAPEGGNDHDTRR
ncbi:DUF551 domain-containing protein [Serratia marcescens]|nr:DUF551 domain-containing protein [Serratia marcescens]